MTITAAQLDNFLSTLRDEENPPPHWSATGATSAASPSGWVTRP